MIFLPQNLPASFELSTRTYELNKWDAIIGCKRVLLLNLMPLKEITEMDIARTIDFTGLDIQIIPLKIDGQHYKNTSDEHMNKYYLSFEEVKSRQFDRLIITGAPLELLTFEEVRYWKSLCSIMDWADSHCSRTLYICWAAQAGLYHFYGIEKHPLAHKMFGVYDHIVDQLDSPLMRNLSPSFFMPNSRYTEVRKDEILQKSGGALNILAESIESGVGLLSSVDLKRTFIVGHLEYAYDTLHNEYCRDVNKGLQIQLPEHYYDNNGCILYSWKESSVSFYHNWLVDY